MLLFVCFLFLFFFFGIAVVCREGGTSGFVFCIFSGSVYLSLAVCFSFRSTVLLLLHLLLSLFPPSLSSELSFIWFYFHLLSFFFRVSSTNAPCRPRGRRGRRNARFLPRSLDAVLGQRLREKFCFIVFIYFFIFVSLFIVLFSISILYVRTCFLFLLSSYVFLFLLLF